MNYNINLGKLITRIIDILGPHPSVTEKLTKALASHKATVTESQEVIQKCQSDIKNSILPQAESIVQQINAFNVLQDDQKTLAFKTLVDAIDGSPLKALIQENLTRVKSTEDKLLKIGPDLQKQVDEAEEHHKQLEAEKKKLEIELSELENSEKNYNYELKDNIPYGQPGVPPDMTGLGIFAKQLAQESLNKTRQQIPRTEREIADSDAQIKEFKALEDQVIAVRDAAKLTTVILEDINDLWLKVNQELNLIKKETHLFQAGLDFKTLPSSVAKALADALNNILEKTNKLVSVVTNFTKSHQIKTG